MIRLLNIALTLEDLTETLVTLGTGALLFIAPHEILAICASGLAIFFWIPRIKRQIRDHYEGSFLNYLKDFFKR